MGSVDRVVAFAQAIESVPPMGDIWNGSRPEKVRKGTQRLNENS
jgi:hypothetical protein